MTGPGAAPAATAATGRQSTEEPARHHPWAAQAPLSYPPDADEITRRCLAAIHSASTHCAYVPCEVE